MTLPKLSVARGKLVGNSAFETDSCNRSALANKLSSYVDRLRDGAVIALDAPWGEGKSWFGRNWEQQLIGKGHRVIYVDAFARDYVDDPFIVLSAEVIKGIKQESPFKHKLESSTIAVAKSLAPLAGKATFNAIIRTLTGETDFADKVDEAIKAAGEKGADAIQKAIEQRIQAYLNDQQSFEHFRNSLEAYTSSHEKPVVIILDELDRCRPTFAVRMIERIKHFFDVPNLVFVLLIHRRQLEHAVKGIYGESTDARAYLEKFLNFNFTLPSVASLGDGWRHIEEVCRSDLQRYQFPDNDHRVVAFRDDFPHIAWGLGLTLRDVKRGIALFAFSLEACGEASLLAYVIALKVKNPSFDKLVSGDPDTHSAAARVLEAIDKQLEARHLNTGQFKFLAAWHRNFFAADSEVAREFRRTHTRPTELFVKMARSLDIGLN